MTNEFIGISIEGDVELSRRLLKLASPEVIGRANKRIAEYVKEKAMQYPRRRTITRKQAYGKTFQSDRQRRFFFSAIRSGRIKVPYQRSGRLRQGWKITPFGSQDWLVINETGYAALVQGQGTQARMMTLIGWKTIEQIADKTAQDQAIRIMSDEITKAAGKMVYA
jgi:hypothetical protein